jgi:hypothetical protein
MKYFQAMKRDTATVLTLDMFTVECCEAFITKVNNNMLVFYTQLHNTRNLKLFQFNSLC